MTYRPRYFAQSEFACKCGNCSAGFGDMQPELLIRLDEARALAGVQFVLNSAMRCPAWNKAQGGSKTSSHLTGWAVDIRARDGATRFAILDGLRLAGFNRLGIAGGFIHVDIDPGKPQSRLWLYGNG